MLMFRRNTCYILIDSYSVKHMQLYRAIHMYRVVCLSLGRNIADVTDSLMPQPVFRPHRMHRVQDAAYCYRCMWSLCCGHNDELC